MKRRATLLILTIIMLGVFNPMVLTAANPIVHFSPWPQWLNKFQISDKGIPQRNIDNGYFFQLLEEQINVEQQADYTHVIKSIVSEAGIQNGSQISIGFNPSYERLDIHEIIVWRDNKPQNRLSGKSFKVIADEKDLERFIYQGSYSAYCILDDIRKGDRIEYSFTLTGRNPIFNNKFFGDIYFQSSQPFAQVYKSLLVSPKRHLNFKSFNKTPKVSVSNKNGLTSYEWENIQVMPPPYSDNQPGWYNNYAYVQVSEYNSWKEVADWGMSVNPITTNIKGSLAQQIAQLKTDAGNDKEKYFRNAVKLVQDEVRYMGVEIGEYSHRANNPEQVFHQRYGDCKDKSLLLASILNSNGIEAHMVLINSGIKSHIEEFLPSPNAFDHAVVVATINNKQVWVDATISYQRGLGSNIYFPEYGKGLILKPGNDQLNNIANTNSGKIQLEEKYTVADEKQKVKLDVTTVYSLYEADKMRDRLASGSMSDLEKNYLKYYTKVHPKIQSTDSITVIDDQAKNQLTTVEHYVIADFLKKSKTNEGKFTASFYANTINEQFPSIANDAKTPVALNYPYSVDYTIKVIMSNGWDIEKSGESIKQDAYTFYQTSRSDADTLFLNYRFNILKEFIPVAKLAEAREDFKKLSDDELGYTITFTPNVSQKPTRPNYWMLALAITLVALLTLLGIKIYKTETPGILFSRGGNFMPIGGWLIFITIGLCISPLIVLGTTLDTGYFDLNKWNAAVSSSTLWGYKALFIFEILGNIILICYSIFCLILLLNKRDILPKYIIGLYAFSLLFSIGDFIFMKAFVGEPSANVGSAILRSIIAAAIWIPYFKKSVRVEQTFIVPYPANNYKYEEHAATNTDTLNS